MDTNSAIFQQILVKLRAFEAQGLRYRVVAPDGQEFVSAAPPEPTKVVKRVNVTRSVVISDIVKDQLAAMQVGDVERLMIPSKYASEITEKSWLSSVSAVACRIFGSGGCTASRVPNGIEVMRLK
jgi:hypothetical protein